VDSNTVQAIGVLLTALGLSSVAGLRAYLPLLATAVGSDLPGSENGHLIALSKPFQALGTPWIIGLLAVLVVGEFFVDKIPIIDHLSDLFHTVVRPASGAIIMAGISNPVSDHSPWVAAAIGALGAFTVHGVKSTARPVVTATTVGHGNPVVSLLEDVLSVVAAVLALLVPIFAVALMLVLTLFVGRLALRGLRRLRGRRKPQEAQGVP
jgi:hypothetical protein